MNLRTPSLLRKAAMLLCVTLATSGLRAQNGNDRMMDLLGQLKERSAAALQAARGIHDPDQLHLWKGTVDVPVGQVASLAEAARQTLTEVRALVVRFEAAARPDFSQDQWAAIDSDLIVIKREIERALNAYPLGAAAHAEHMRHQGGCGHDNDELLAALEATWEVHAAIGLIAGSIDFFSAAKESK